MNLPYVLADFTGIGGDIKQRPEDFFVQELPLYEPSGEGEHVYCEIQKIRVTTFQVVDQLARALNVPRMDVGYAGMKDAQAITRQIFSIRGVTEKQVMDLHLPNLSFLWAARHQNKLRLGHLAGNRFAIKIRNVSPTDVVKVAPQLGRLTEIGMPNYFGEQRFGRRQNNHLLGAALIRGDDREVLRLLLGDPQPEIDDPEQVEARTAFSATQFELAMKRYPRHCGMERRLLARFIKVGRPGAAVRCIDEKLRRLWISALQSSLFNEVLAARIGSLDRLLPGDLAMKEDNGAVFPVEDVAVEQPRVQSWEISPSGPLLGYRMTLPTGEALAIEQAVFTAHQLNPKNLRVEGRHKVKGARRALRVRPRDTDVAAGVDEHGSHITLAFTLPAGSFATVLVREITKNDTTRPEAEIAAATTPD